MVIQTISGRAVPGCQCLRTFSCFLRPESGKWLFGKLHLCPSI